MAFEEQRRSGTWWQEASRLRMVRLRRDWVQFMSAKSIPYLDGVGPSSSDLRMEQHGAAPYLYDVTIGS